MSADTGQGATAPRYMRAEIRSCDRHFVEADDGARVPYLSLRGYNGRNEPVRVIVRGRPGERHDEGDLAEVSRQFAATGGEGMETRRVARVLGTVRQGKSSEYYDAVEVVRLNGPGADFVLAKRDGVMALETAAKLHAAGDVDGAFRLLEDTVARMCAVPAPSVAREADLAGRHPGPDPEGAAGEEVVPPGEEPEDRARRFYRAADAARGRVAVPAPEVPVGDGAGPTAAVRRDEAAEAAPAPAPADVPAVEMPVHVAERTDAADATTEAEVPAEPAEPEVPVGAEIPAEPAPGPEAVTEAPGPEAVTEAAADPEAVTPAVSDADATGPVEAPAHETPGPATDPEAGPAEDRDATPEPEPATEATDTAGASVASETTTGEATPPAAEGPAEVAPAVAEPSAKPESGKPAAPAMPGFRSRARMGVPNVVPTAAPAASRPVADVAQVAKPEAPRAETRATATPARPVAGRPTGRPRMGMGGTLPPPVRSEPEQDEEPASPAPGR